MPNDSEDISSERFLATLVRGECHYLRDIRFDRDVATVIEEHHRDHLLEHAVDVVDNPGWNDEYGTGGPRTISLAKFRFLPYFGELETGSTVGADAIGSGVDEAAAARLRRFGELETARHAKAPATEAPKFDPDAHRTKIECPADVVEEAISAPRARPPRHPRSTTAA